MRVVQAWQRLENKLFPLILRLSSTLQLSKYSSIESSVLWNFGIRTFSFLWKKHPYKRHRAWETIVESSYLERFLRVIWKIYVVIGCIRTIEHIIIMSEGSNHTPWTAQAKKCHCCIENFRKFFQIGSKLEKNWKQTDAQIIDKIFKRRIVQYFKICYELPSIHYLLN